MVCTSDWCKITSIPRYTQYLNSFLSAYSNFITNNSSRLMLQQHEITVKMSRIQENNATFASLTVIIN